MKTLGIEQATLDSCVREAQDDRVLLTRDGRPVAVVVGRAWTGRSSAPRGRRTSLLRIAVSGTGCVAVYDTREVRRRLASDRCGV